MTRPACLVESHWDDLERSGLTTDTILKASLHSGSADEVRDILGYGTGTGLVIPYTVALNGSGPPFARVRIDHPGPDGKKYRSPKGSTNRLYIPPILDRTLLDDVACPLYVTEGEKKALKACQEGLACIGLAGVWSWRTKSSSGQTGPLPDLDRIPFKGRKVYVVFDSDLATNEKVRHAEAALAAELAGRGAEVYRIPLPAGPSGEKVGLDDYLLTHSVEALCALEPVPIGTTADVQVTGATIEEILATDPATLQTTYIVTPWVPRYSLCALSAKAGVGKGKLAQDLCIARVTGQPWLGLPVEPGPALFWSGEQGKREDFRVTQALCRGRGIGAAAFAHYFEVIHDPPVSFGHPTMTAHVMRRLQEHPGLLIVIDSQRRAFEGEESDSSAADTFYRNVLVPLRAAGASVLTLAHPPKTTGQQKGIADENMIRGSGDWLAQLDSFMVLRPVNRERSDRATETVTMRLVHAKTRSGPQAAPLLVSLRVTGDLTPFVAFTLTASTAADDAAADLAGAVKAAAGLFEEQKRLSRRDVLEALQKAEHGRPAAEGALKRLVDLGVIHGPLAASEKRKGERGHWYLFMKPLSTPSEPDGDAPEWLDDPDEAPDDL